MRKVHKHGSPHDFARKRKERRVRNFAPSWTILELASAFFEVLDFDAFRGVRREGPAAEGEPP